MATPGYCWYNNSEPANKIPNGALYNWYTVQTGKLCPTGWHVPTKAEWTTLINQLGGLTSASGKLKETGTSHWLGANADASNESGFTAVPGGYRSYDGTFSGLGYVSDWWTATEDNLSYPWSISLMYFDNNVYLSSMNVKRNGFSIRCLKD
jgi:uncharacterized protein (TIGR02145 family)